MNTKNGINRKILIGIGSIVILAIVLSIIFMGGSSTAKVIENSNTITIPLSEVSTEAQFYEYDGIKYFAVKASDGSIRTAFDACDVCGGTKGYRQEGKDMVCNNCGRHFSIDSLGEKNVFGGGCWPGYLENSVENENIVIQKANIEDNNYEF